MGDLAAIHSPPSSVSEAMQGGSVLPLVLNPVGEGPAHLVGSGLPGEGVGSFEAQMLEGSEDAPSAAAAAGHGDATGPHVMSHDDAECGVATNPEMSRN